VTRPRVLVVEDDPGISLAIKDHLEAHGWPVTSARSVREALESFEIQDVRAVITDYALPDGNAFDLVSLFKSTEPPLPVILLTGHPSPELERRAQRSGVDEFLVKPVKLPALEAMLARFEESVIEQAARPRRSRLEAALSPFLGTSEAIRTLEQLAVRIADSRRPVLIQGETGTGKGVLAGWLHAHGPDATGPFVDLNCAGLAREFLESELFGHEKGAFTGATQAKPGLIETAAGGSLFLDEIGDTDPAVQSKLLKVLETNTFRRLGSVHERRVSLRILTAAGRPLEQLVAEGKFRADLFFRINGLPLLLPPLRERMEDVPLLARRLLHEIASVMSRGPLALTPDAEAKLGTHTWPGNIRELRNVLERAAILSSATLLGVEDIEFHAAKPAPPREEPPSSMTLHEVQRDHIVRVLKLEKNNVARAAQHLGVSRSTLYEMLDRFGIERTGGVPE
jgi:DNA-binding NtrC family response regulator